MPIHKQKTFDFLVANDAIQDVVRWQSRQFEHLCLLRGSLSEELLLDCFKRYAPRVASWHDAELSKIYDVAASRGEELVPLFDDSSFPSVAFNLGPKTVCDKHRDKEDAAIGVCAVTSSGPYDYRKGGHLVLWELGLIVELPPGATVLFPSALITHSNCAIQAGEERWVFSDNSPLP